jgi:glycosyltransferase involved in cell wall biosynthesis
MMAGLPVVALDMGAAPEIIKDGTTGLLVAADSASLAEALLGLCADPNARERIGAAGRRRYEERFTVVAMADGAERIFAALPVPEVS